MLTIAETALTVAGIGVGGTALGGYLAARAGRLSSLQTAQQQRRLEADRRRDDRRAALYQEMITRSIRSTREAFERAAQDPHNAEPREDADADAWAARVRLFASPQVEGLWSKWIDALSSLWYSAVPPGERPNGARTEAIKGVRVARETLVQQMRRELESWDS